MNSCIETLNLCGERLVRFAGPMLSRSSLLITAFANTKKVCVLRALGNGDRKKIPLNIDDMQKGKAADVILQPKDIVAVPEKFFHF